MSKLLSPLNPSPCEWCGQPHDPAVLCRANTVRTSRRKFLFLFGAGMAGLAMGGLPHGIVPTTYIGEASYIGESCLLRFDVGSAQWTTHPVRFAVIYTDGVHRLLARSGPLDGINCQINRIEVWDGERQSSDPDRQSRA